MGLTVSGIRRSIHVDLNGQTQMSAPLLTALFPAGTDPIASLYHMTLSSAIQPVGAPQLPVPGVTIVIDVSPLPKMSSFSAAPRSA